MHPLISKTQWYRVFLLEYIYFNQVKEHLHVENRAKASSPQPFFKILWQFVAPIEVYIFGLYT